jgi:perosamine synthetase
MPRDYRVPMSAPDIAPEDIALVTRALESKVLSLGPFLDQMETAFAAYIGSRHAIGVTNGTSGLHLCIRAAGIADGDEVITSAFSFVATANCILYERAVPVFVDIDETTFNLDPARAAAAVTARTRAILPVHVFGRPCAMHELAALCDANGLALIEDACEAVGAEYDGRKVGTFGKAAVFAFYPNKQMTMGEGAVVTTDDPSWAALMRSLRNQGRDAMGAGVAHEHLGYNYRLDEMSAALGLSQLRRIDDLLARRAAVAGRYDRLLRGIPGISIRQALPSRTRASWFVYVIQVAPGIDRDRLIAQLEARQIPARAYFTPIHLQPYYRQRFGFREGHLPVTERIAATTLALPFHTNLAADDMDRVVEALRAAVMRAAA